jgi:hypothetical protein
MPEMPTAVDNLKAVRLQLTHPTDTEPAPPRRLPNEPSIMSMKPKLPLISATVVAYAIAAAAVICQTPLLALY